MKLFVDDIRNAPDDTWLVARTNIAAIKALNQFSFDEISLDHDISHQIVVGTLSRPYPCEDCFCPVAYFIAATLDDPAVTIHTSNPVAAKEMEEILKDHGITVTHKHFGAANRLEMEL